MTEQKISEVAVDVAEGAENKKDINEDVIASTGVVVRTKRVPPMVLGELTRKYKKPQAPRVKNAFIGTEEYNYADPDYNKAVDEWNTEITFGMVDVYLVMGTEIVSIPDGFPELDSDDWTEDFEIIGIEISEKKKGRYLQYMKFVVLPDPDDINAIVDSCSRKSGVPEEDVQEAAEHIFRDNTGQRADTKS